MKDDQSFQPGARGCLVEVAIALPAVVVMLAISASYRHFSDDFACDGKLGLGFPVSFLCDYGTGSSPISSWGRVDLADFPYFSLHGLSADILFYSVILWVGWLVRRAFRHNDRYPFGTAIQVALIGIAFAAGFLFAAIIFKAERINFQGYLLGMPTPVAATATPFGTPPPEETPIPTLGP